MTRSRRTLRAPPGGFRLPPVHPGLTLAAELTARGMTAHALALKLQVPANRISAIVSGNRSMSGDSAARLGRYFGTGASFWMILQSQYDLAVAERDLDLRVGIEAEEAGWF